MPTREPPGAAANREAQRAYRERHGENLKAARRVGTALMSLRSPRGYYKMNGIARALRRFLTEAEVRELVKELKKKAGKSRTAANLAERIREELAKTKGGKR